MRETGRSRRRQGNEVDVASYLSFGGYDLLIEPGERPELIVAVTSFGLNGRRPDFEWISTGQAIADGRHLMFLRDCRQSWFNAEEGWEDLLAAIRTYCSTHGIERIFAFGISMGAFGAGLLATRLPVTAVLLMAPQVSIDPDIAGFDGRFMPLWRDLPTRNRSQLAPTLTDAPRFLCCFSVDELVDVRHAALLRTSAPDCAYLPIRGEHNVGRELLMRGQHIPLLRYFLGDRPLPDLPVFPGPVALVFSLSDMVTANDVAGLERHADTLFRSKRLHWAPGFLFPIVRWKLRPRKGSLAAVLFKWLGRRAYPAHRGMVMHDANVGPYRVRGWSDLDGEGYRATADRAILRMIMIDADVSAGVRLLIGGRLLVAQDAPRTIRILQHRRLLAERQVQGSGETDVECIVTAHGRRIEIAIETDGSLSSGGTLHPPGFLLTQLRILYD